TAQVQAQPEAPSELDRLAEELANLEARGDQIRVALERIELRLAEMMAYRSSVEQEAGRLERAMKAGSVLADLKVTHCPVCDQPVTAQTSETTCYLCQRPMSASATATSAARLEMEVAQTKAILQEATEMVAVLEKDK